MKATMRIALVNRPLVSAVCDLGGGDQLPLGLLMVGGLVCYDGEFVNALYLTP